MKATGIVRKIDNLGRIVLPIELRKSLGMETGTTVEIYVDDGGYIILEKVNPKCFLCESNEDLVLFKGKNLCSECINKIKDI